MNSHETNVNGPNSCLKCSKILSDLCFTDKTAGIASHTCTTILMSNNICPCKQLNFAKKTDIKPASINFSYDNMGYQ